MKLSWPKRVAENTRNTWTHKEDNAGTHILVQSTRQKSHPNRHLTVLASHLMEALKSPREKEIVY